jgi:integrase/recombinase XerD
MKNLPLNTYAYRELELDFKEWLALLGYAETTVYAMPLYMHEFFYWLEREAIRQVAQITAAHVHAFILQLEDRPHAIHGGKLSPAHINKYHQGLILLSQFVRQTGKGSFTVETERLDQPRTMPDVLTPAEIEALYQACDSSILGLRDKAMLGIFYGCGLRRNEGVHLDVSDIDFKGQLVYVRKGKNYKERYVPVSEVMLQHLKDYLDHSRPFLQRKGPLPALLVSDKGNRAQGQTLMLRLQKLTQAAGIGKDVGLHTLRHSIATHLLHNGMALKYIATFLGHASLESTQIYTHLTYENL